MIINGKEYEEAVYHLSWDGKQNNGIIMSPTYPSCMFKGGHLKPNLSFKFDSLQYSEVFDQYYTLSNLGAKMNLTEAQKNECKAKAMSWVQEPGQEGSQAWIDEQETARLEHEEAMALFDEFLATKGKKRVVSETGFKVEDI